MVPQRLLQRPRPVTMKDETFCLTLRVEPIQEALDLPKQIVDAETSNVEPALQRWRGGAGGRLRRGQLFGA